MRVNGQRLAQAFSYLALLIMCAAIMVVALVIGALAAITGAAGGGLLGLGLVALFLASLIVFMWELLRRDPLDALALDPAQGDEMAEQDPGATGADDQGQHAQQPRGALDPEQDQRGQDQHHQAERVNDLGGHGAGPTAGSVAPTRRHADAAARTDSRPATAGTCR